jgi:hypothetical protein
MLTGALISFYGIAGTGLLFGPIPAPARLAALAEGILLVAAGAGLSWRRIWGRNIAMFVAGACALNVAITFMSGGWIVTNQLYVNLTGTGFLCSPLIYLLRPSVRNEFE